MTDARREPPVPRLAATMLLVRYDPFEVLMVGRNDRGQFASALVFPGGVVDPDDRDEAWLDHVDDVAGADVSGAHATEHRNCLTTQRMSNSSNTVLVETPFQERHSTFYLIEAVEDDVHVRCARAQEQWRFRASKRKRPRIQVRHLDYNEAVGGIKVHQRPVTAYRRQEVRGAMTMRKQNNWQLIARGRCRDTKLHCGGPARDV